MGLRVRDWVHFVFFLKLALGWWLDLYSISQLASDGWSDNFDAVVDGSFDGVGVDSAFYPMLDRNFYAMVASWQPQCAKWCATYRMHTEASTRRYTPGVYCTRCISMRYFWYVRATMAPHLKFKRPGARPLPLVPAALVNRPLRACQLAVALADHKTDQASIESH